MVFHGLKLGELRSELLALQRVLDRHPNQLPRRAEGVGRATTRSVVQAISAIIVTAMVVVIISTV